MRNLDLIVVCGMLLMTGEFVDDRSSGFPTRSDTNRAVQSHKMARGLKFRI